jgi:integrase
MSAFDVRIHAIRRRPDRRRPFEVRWHAAGRARSRSFITRGLAEGCRAELIRAARKGLDFSPGTGEPASWAAPEAATISWLEHAAAYAAMKWPLAAAHTRAGIADALATIAPALLTPGRGRPPAAVLRAALYGHAFNPARAGTDPGPAAAVALGWAWHHCLPLTAVADPAVTRRVLEALALRLDETRAAATTIIRKRAVFHGCLGYAAELGLLQANPLDRITWRSPRSSGSAGPRSAAAPAEVQAILAEVTQIRPELTAFFGCLYYAALRPAEAVALRADSCILPSRGWGQLILTGLFRGRRVPGLATARHANRAASNTRPEGAIRTVPITPQLAGLLARTCRPSGAPKMGGCSGVPAAARSAKASTAGSGTRPAPQPSRRTGQAPRRCAAPSTCAMPRCRCGWPPAPARRDRCPRRAQSACPAHHLRPRHDRLRPDRQPAHRASLPPRPMAPRWPTRTGVDAGNPVRHASVPQLDSTGHSWT